MHNRVGGSFIEHFSRGGGEGLGGLGGISRVYCSKWGPVRWCFVESPISRGVWGHAPPRKLGAIRGHPRPLLTSLVDL